MADGTMRRLSVSAAAKRAGMKTDTFRAYVTRAELERAAGRDRPGLAPSPDGIDEIFGRRWWYSSTIDEWKKSRPGQGARTDLIRS